MESRIYDFFVKIFVCLGRWFDESIFGRLFNRVSAFFARAFSDSVLGKIFGKMKDGKDVISGSLFFKIICFPVSILKSIAKVIPENWENIYKKSVLVYLADNFELISTKVYGSVFMLIPIIATYIGVFPFCIE